MKGDKVVQFQQKSRNSFLLFIWRNIEIHRQKFFIAYAPPVADSICDRFEAMDKCI